MTELATAPLALSDGRIRITALAPADAPALAALGDDPTVARMMTSIPSPFREEDAARRIARTTWRGVPGFTAGIRTADGTLIGEIGLGPEAEPSLLYWLGAAHRGQGNARAACTLFLDFVFARLGPESLVAETYDDNPASAGLLRRLGFAEAGGGLDTHHPLRPEGARYTGFRLTRADWEARG